MIGQGVGGVAQIQEPARKAKSLRIKVVDNRDGRSVANVKLPIGLVKFGMKMARTFSPELRDANLDWDALSAMIEEGAMGELVHVEDEAENRTIEVWVD